MPFQDSTRRAYTLKLAGINKEETSWRSLIWETHETVNRGARVFGDLWLTIRAGLAPSLAIQGKGGNVKVDRNRAILLALGWFVVEAPPAVEERYIIARADQPREARQIALLNRLTCHLQQTGIANIDSWLAHCRDSLASDIRNDSVWVDRRQMFLDQVEEIGWTSDHASQLLFDMLGKEEKYFKIDSPDEEQSGDADSPKEGKSEDADKSEGADKGEAKDFAKKASGWFSGNWGSGKKSNTGAILGKLRIIADLDYSECVDEPPANALKKILENLAGATSSQDAESLFQAIRNQMGWKGRSSVGFQALKRLTKLGRATADFFEDFKGRFEKEIKDKQAKAAKGVIPWAATIKARIERQIQMVYRTTKDHTWEFGVMLDHALRKVSINHSWVKLAEESRQQFEKDASTIPDAAVENWIGAYCSGRTISSGSNEDYVIRKNALDGWEEVAQAWLALGVSATPEERVSAARGLQEDIEKFGDIQLFEAFAQEDPQLLWLRSGRADPGLLRLAILRRIAIHNTTRFKVPAYRHPDPLLHPVFCDYGNSRWGIYFSAQNPANPKRPDNPRDLSLGVWTGSEIKDLPLRWQSKRFAREIASCRENLTGPVVSRNHKAARVAAGTDKGQLVRIDQLFGKKDWNGRLQAPREYLERVARIRDSANLDPKKLAKAISQIPWLITFSAPLVPQGPWIDLVDNTPLFHLKKADGKVPKPLANLAPKTELEEVGGLAFPFFHPQAEKGRKGMARLHLSRIPGLRILSVDLGHRHAAACAVWRVLTSAQMAELSTKNGVSPPRPDQLSLVIKAGGKSFVLRRIGPDFLQEMEPHPAPWAILERQFPLSLAGEKGEARFATTDERNEVAYFESQMGFIHGKPRKSRSWRMDRLLMELVQKSRVGLAKHAAKSRLANGLTATFRILPGDRQEPFTAETRLDFLADLLVDFHRLVTDAQWPETEAHAGWCELTKNMLSDADRAIPEESVRVHHSQTSILRKKLIPLAKRFVKEPDLGAYWTAFWSSRWLDADQSWPKQLKWLSRLLMPRKTAETKSLRRKGGLSLGRITTIEEFRRKVQLAFFARKTPEGSRQTPGEDFSLKAMSRMDRLRQNRVRQISSRIAGAALGIGPDKDNPNRLVKRFDPCHAVVIEDLTNYQPEVSQTRRENRQLMRWSSSKVKKLLSEACQLGGIHLRHVSPAFTSRQDSRTGAPGMRCVEVSTRVLAEPGCYWLKDAEKATERIRLGHGTSADRYLVEVMECAKKGTLPPTVLLPKRGGDLFVSSHPKAPLAIQADLNAAANIGLAALLDPDWIGRFWFVPAGKKDHKPSVEGTPVFEETPVLPVLLVVQTKTNAKEKKSSQTEARHFRDPSNDDPAKGPWYVGFAAYELSFMDKVMQKLTNKYLNNPEDYF